MKYNSPLHKILNKDFDHSLQKSKIMSYVIFGIILLHLVVGFGWLVYKLEIQKDKPKVDEDIEDKTNI